MADEGVTTATRLCDQCLEPLPPPKGKRHGRRFCSGRCRAKWHQEDRQRRIATAVMQVRAALTALHRDIGEAHKALNRIPK